MLRSVLIALAAALTLVVIISWQSIMSAGFSQLSGGWDRLITYYNKEPISLPGIVTDKAQITPLIPKMVAANVGLANSPYPETQTDGSRLTTPDGECIAPKANLDEVSFFLRTNLFEPLDPVVVRHARDAKLSPDLTKFFTDYGYGLRRLTTNAAGERMTVPAVEQPRKVIVAGDSSAFGSLLDDGDTLASKLQAKDSTRQYVNLGVPEASGEQVICHLAKAAARYRGQVEELVYLYSEDDLAPGQKFGTPEEIIAALKGLVQSETIAKVTVVYIPSLYNVAAALTRHQGYGGAEAPNPQAAREKLRQAVAGAQFAWLDIGEIALADGQAQASPFSVLGNFADHKNLSARGIDILAGKIPLPVQPEALALSAASAGADDPPEASKTGNDLEDRARKQSAALDDIRAAVARAAKNNRLKRDIDDILKKLKGELAGEP